MDRFKSIFAVGFGGAAGAILRYCVILTAGHSIFPFGTLLINIVGSFLLGMINGYFRLEKEVPGFFSAGQRVLRRLHHDVHIFPRSGESTADFSAIGGTVSWSYAFIWFGRWFPRTGPF